MIKDIMKFKLILTLALIFNITNLAMAQEINIEEIEKPIEFINFEQDINHEEQQAAKEFNALLKITEDAQIKEPININNTRLIDIKIAPSAQPPTNKEVLENAESSVILKEEIEKTELSAQKKTLKELLKGEKSPNALLFAMYSIHTSDDKDERNGQQDLIGMQYDGKVFMFFRNSFYHNTVIAGLSRDVYKKQLTKNTKFDFGYKAGVMYGYHEEYPNLLGITPAILPMFGLTYKGKGIDMYVVPDFSPTFIFNVRFELPNKKV